MNLAEVQFIAFSLLVSKIFENLSISFVLHSYVNWKKGQV